MNSRTFQRGDLGILNKPLVKIWDTEQHSKLAMRLQDNQAAEMTWLCISIIKSFLTTTASAGLELRWTLLH